MVVKIIKSFIVILLIQYSTNFYAQIDLKYTKAANGYHYFNGETINLNLCFPGDYVFDEDKKEANTFKWPKNNSSTFLFQGKTIIPPFIHVEGYLYQNIIDFELFLIKIKSYKNLRLEGIIGYDTYSLDFMCKKKKGKVYYIEISKGNILKLIFWQNFNQELFEKEIEMILKLSFHSN